jgi:hypothetical protein
VEHGSAEIDIKLMFAEAYERVKEGNVPTFTRKNITGEQYGLIAVHMLRERGHELLAEFEIVGGVAYRRQVTRTIYGAKNLLLGGVIDVERVLVRGERLPTWGEVGWAVLDVAIVVGSVGAVAKTLKAAKAARVARTASAAAKFSALRTAGSGAFKAIAAVGKTAIAVSPIAVVYVAVTKPELIVSAGGWIAEQAGFPWWVGVFAVYLAMLLFVAIVLRLLRPLWRPVVRALRWYFSGSPYDARRV